MQREYTQEMTVEAINAYGPNGVEVSQFIDMCFHLNLVRCIMKTKKSFELTHSRNEVFGNIENAGLVREMNNAIEDCGNALMMMLGSVVVGQVNPEALCSETEFDEINDTIIPMVEYLVSKEVK